jgi:hypothetical protein
MFYISYFENPDYPKADLRAGVKGRGWVKLTMKMIWEVKESGKRKKLLSKKPKSTIPASIGHFLVVETILI